MFIWLIVIVSLAEGTLEEFALNSTSYVCTKYQALLTTEVPPYGSLRSLVGANNVVYKMVLDSANCADFDSCLSHYKTELDQASARAWGVSFVLLGFLGLWFGLTYVVKMRAWRARLVDWLGDVMTKQVMGLAAIAVFVVLNTLFFIYRNAAINGLNVGFCGLSVLSSAVLEGSANEFAGFNKLVSTLQLIDGRLTPGSNFSESVIGVFNATEALPASLDELVATLTNLQSVMTYTENQDSAQVYVCVLCKLGNPYVLPVASEALAGIAASLRDARQAARDFVEGESAAVVTAAVKTATSLAVRVKGSIESWRSSMEEVGEALSRSLDIILACVITFFMTVTLANVAAFSFPRFHWFRCVIPHVTVGLGTLVFAFGVLALAIAYFGGSACEVLLDVPAIFDLLGPRFGSQEVADGVVDAIAFCLSEEGTVLEVLKSGDVSVADIVQQTDSVVASMEAVSALLANAASLVSLHDSEPFEALIDVVNTLTGVFMVTPNAYSELQVNNPPSFTDMTSASPETIAKLYVSAHTTSTVCDDRTMSAQLAADLIADLGISLSTLSIPGVDSYLSGLQDEGISVGVNSCSDLDTVPITGSRKAPWGDLLQLKKDVRADQFRCSNETVCTFSEFTGVLDALAVDLAGTAADVDAAKDASLAAINVTLRSALIDEIVDPLREMNRLTNCTFVKKLWSESVYGLCNVGFAGVVASAHVVLWIGIFMLMEFLIIGALLVESQQPDTASMPQRN